MIDYREIADQINMSPEMIKTLLLEHLFSLGHVINYEPGMNNTFYSTFVIYLGSMFYKQLLTGSLSILPLLHDDLIIQNEKLLHLELGRDTAKFYSEF